MTQRDVLFLWLVVTTIIVSLLSATGVAAIDARRRARMGMEDLRLTAEQVHQLRTLRQAASPEPASSEPVAGLTQRLSAALAACGLPGSALAGVSPQADTAKPIDGVGGLRTVHRQATVTLGPITLPQAGQLFDIWRKREPRWIISSIEITPESNSAATNTGGDLPLRVSLTLEAIGVEQTPGAGTGASR